VGREHVLRSSIVYRAGRVGLPTLEEARVGMVKSGHRQLRGPPVRVFSSLDCNWRFDPAGLVA
jgi:hypothetical protein